MPAEEYPANRLKRPVGPVVMRYKKANQLLEMFAKTERISIKDLRGRSSYRPYVEKRKEFARLARKQGIGSVIIGYLLERDHTTILHYINPSIYKGKRARYKAARIARTEHGRLETTVNRSCDSARNLPII